MKIINFFRKEDGTATIEAVLWLPVFISFFCLITDASFIFFGQNKAYRIVQDANRSLSIGRLDSAADVEGFIQAKFATFAPNAVISTQISGGTVSTIVDIPATDLVATGFITALTTPLVTVAASHFVEY